MIPVPTRTSASAVMWPTQADNVLVKAIKGVFIHPMLQRMMWHEETQITQDAAATSWPIPKAHDRRTRNSYEKLAPKTRTRNLREIEHALFDARNSCEKYLAASRYDTRTSFSRELTRTRFSYVCHGLKLTLTEPTAYNYARHVQSGYGQMLLQHHFTLVVNDV